MTTVWHAAASALLISALVGCGGRVAAPTPIPTQAAGFDVAHVIANFTDECRDPAVVDALFCQQVDIAHMTGEGTILNVPTHLASSDDARAEAICNMFAFAHFDNTGKTLGYETIGILDSAGGNLAACFTRS